jgi:hypothetical protein
LALLTACGGETTADLEPVSSVESPIAGGYRDDDDTQAVGIAHLSQGGFGACSGTLIAPNVVLTAQHCVARSSGNGLVNCGSTTFSPASSANEFYITTHTSFTQDINNYHFAREVHVPPGTDAFCGRDVALIILTDSIDASEAVPSTPRVDVQLEPNEEYYAIGYGQRGGNQNDPSGTRYRRDGLFTQCVGAGCGFNSSVAETEWLGETGICSGDSGGGAFDLQDRVHGIVSRGAQGCEYPIYGGVFGWADWIKEVTIHASELAGAAPPPWAEGFPTDPQYNHPVGDACVELDDCPSGACLDHYCTRACTELATCPDGYQCRVDGYCEQIPEPEPEAPASPPRVVSGGCTIALDATKPTPWDLAPWVLGAVAAWRRRRSPRTS